MTRTSGNCFCDELIDLDYILDALVVGETGEMDHSGVVNQPRKARQPTEQLGSRFWSMGEGGTRFG
jgi:hypothetical protein